MLAGAKLCPSVNIGSKGVYPASSPKSYWNFPRVSLGQEAGSAAMKRVFFPVENIVPHEGESNTAEVGTSAKAGNDHIGIFTCHLHLFFGFQADDCLMQRIRG